MHDDDFDDLITADAQWWIGWQFLLQGLADNETGQLVMWPVDDLIGKPRYVPCPKRGTHIKTTECWLCFGDWAWGYATASEVLAPDDQQ